MRIIAVANQKGGCGKTMTAINLAAALQAQHRAVLLVDLDPQAHATTGLGLQPDQYELNTYHALSLTTQPPVPLAAVVRQTPYCDVATGHILLSTLEQELAGQEGGISRLSQYLQTLPTPYDVVILDTPPSLGFLTFNALRAADEVLVPIEASWFSIQGVSKLMSMVELVQTRTGHRLRSVKALLTLYDRRTRYTQQVAEQVRQLFGVSMYQTVISANVRLREAVAAGKPILYFDASATGSRDYRALAQEVLEDGRRLDPSAFAASARALARRVAFNLRHRDAAQVHVVGDFNGWRVADSGSMHANGNGEWRTEFQLRPGRYRYKFVVDGRWQEDPVNPQQEANDFGSVDSILTVE